MRSYESLSSEEYRAHVLEENCLARASRAARKKLWQELKNRYILDREHPLFAAFWREWRRCKSEPERGLTTYILLALNDRLVADLGTEWLIGYLRRLRRSCVPRMSGTSLNTLGWPILKYRHGRSILVLLWPRNIWRAYETLGLPVGV